MLSNEKKGGMIFYVVLPEYQKIDFYYITLYSHCLLVLLEYRELITGGLTPMTIELKGITWNHTRGYLPMMATSQRFSETHPGVQITWKKRTLQEFADFPLHALINEYDLLVIDHPWAGYAAKSGVLVPLNEHLSAEYLANQAANSVGVSHTSYQFNGVQTALAIDAATPVSSYRPDLLSRLDLQIPNTWEELLDLAGQERVIFPAIPVDSLMNFYMLCTTLGEEMFCDPEFVVSPAVGTRALEYLRELACLCPKEIFTWNPIAVYEQLSRQDQWVYCPFAYGYSNYSRSGYSLHPLHFGDLVSLGSEARLRSTLGGTGLAISSSCQHLELALEYAEFTASPLVQRTMFYESGGQPGHRSAWIDPVVNQSCANYYQQTLPALDNAYLRPRYDGYLRFQDHGGDFVRDYMMNGGSILKVLESLNALYRESLPQS